MEQKGLLFIPDISGFSRFSKVYDADIITLFHATGDFQHRSKWQESVRKVVAVNYYFPRVGMKLRCVIDGKDTTIYSSSYRYQDDRIEFTETEEGGRVRLFDQSHASMRHFFADNYERQLMYVCCWRSLIKKNKPLACEMVQVLFMV